MVGSLALLLADGRLPTGAYAHSGGTGWAVREGVVTDVESLERWCRLRLDTIGLTDAALATWVGRRWPDVDLGVVDAEVTARLSGPGAVATSRRLGRGWRRLAEAVAPGALDGIPAETHRVVVLGALGAVLDVADDEIAAVVTHDVVAEATTAAVRLLGLDAHATAALQVRLAAASSSVVVEAGAAAAGPLPACPCRTSPILELALEGGVIAPERLFAS